MGKRTHENKLPQRPFPGISFFSYIADRGTLQCESVNNNDIPEAKLNISSLLQG
jgi:hypothetical protein